MLIFGKSSGAKAPSGPQPAGWLDVLARHVLGLASVGWIHRSLAWTLVALIALYLAGVSGRCCFRELAAQGKPAAMISGRRRPQEPGDVD